MIFDDHVNITQSFLLTSLIPYLKRGQQIDMCTQYKHTDKNNNMITAHNKLMVFQFL